MRPDENRAFDTKGRPTREAESPVRLSCLSIGWI